MRRGMEGGGGRKTSVFLCPQTNRLWPDGDGQGGTPDRLGRIRRNVGFLLERGERRMVSDEKRCSGPRAFHRRTGIYAGRGSKREGDSRAGRGENYNERHERN